MIFFLKKITKKEAGEVVQWLKACTGCFIRGTKFTHADHVTTTYNSGFKESDGFFRPPWTPPHRWHAYVVGTHKSLFTKDKTLLIEPL